MAFRESRPWKQMASLPFLRNFSLNLGLLCALISLNVFSNGYDLSIYNSLQAMTPFARTFGSCNPTTHKCSIPTKNLSMLNAMPLIGYAVGILGASFVGESFGRRIVYILVLVVCLIGIGVSFSASTFGQILAGRILVNMSVGMESWLVPLYQAEIVPGQVRGALVTLYGLFRVVGSLVVACITYKTANYTDNWSWKLPLAIMFVVPGICLCLSWFVPESPRYLLRKGKDREALKVLHRLYGGHELYDAELELVLLKQSLELEEEKGTFFDLWRGSNLRRTIIAVLSAFFSQACGQPFANQYGVIFIRSLGTINAFELNVITVTCGILGILIFISFVDKLGRRFFYHTFALFASLTMIVIASLSCVTTLTPSIKVGIAAMFPLYSFFYLGSFPQLQVLTSAEIPSLKLRDKTAMVAWSIQNLTQFVSSFTVPYLMDSGYGDLSGKVGFIYGAIGVCGVVWAYFYFPELKQRSLEEIDEMLRQGIKARKTRKWKLNPDSIGVQLTSMEDPAAMSNATYVEDGGKRDYLEAEHLE